MDAWNGRLLRVNLTSGGLKTEEISPGLLRDFIGGRGLAVKLLRDEVPAGTEPLAPESKLVLAAGPLTGSGAPCGSVGVAASRSPLTGAIACATIKGHFASELKHAGLDAVVIEGRAKHPVYLSILQDRARLLPALQLWGRSTERASAIIKGELKDPWLAREAKVLSIGPSGERGDLVATLVNEGCLVQGGAGLGAVLGAKNLKAVVCRGTAGVSVADGGLFIRCVSALLSKLSSRPFTSEVLPSSGTPFLLGRLAEAGALPQGCLQTGDAATGLSRGLSAHRTGAWGCFACPIGCKQLTEVRGGSDFTGQGMGPEYGALGQFAASCGVTDARAVLAANYICTSCGIDPVSAGAAIACAMGLARMGRLPVSENGLVLSSGDPASLLGCLESMASGKGLGKLLAQGARRLADHAGAPETFMGVKGLELPPYEPRAVQGLGLHFATSNFGAYDLNGLTVIDEVLGVHRPANPLEVAGKAEQVKMYQDAIAAVDSMGVCVLPLMAVWLKDLVPVFKSATGMDINAEGLMKAGERIWNLERLFNLREGINGATDTLPERFTREPIPAGPAAGKVCELSRMLPEYYRLRGWNEKGAPLPEKLSDLGLA